MTTLNEQYKGYILIVRQTSLEEASQDLISIPMIFSKDMVEQEDFDFADYIEPHQELIFIQTYDMMTQQLLALRKLAKKSDIELSL